MKIVVATHNEGKLPEIRTILREALGQKADEFELVSAGSLGLPDPVETEVTFEGNALLKARDVAMRTGLPAVADDSGLIVDVLGKAPGILSARWSGVHGDDKANVKLLLAQLGDIPDAHRTARFCCAAVLVVPQYDGDDGDAIAVHKTGYEEVVHLGEMPGVIVRTPRGEHGFGYDPIFEPADQPTRAKSAGTRLTSAEMTPEEKNAISHRRRAFTALAPAVGKLLTK